MSVVLDPIDQIAARAFEGFVVRKDLVRKFKAQYPVPTYVVEFLLGRYCASTDEAEIQEGLQIVERQLSNRSVRNALKPLRIVFATARREGAIAHNPSSEAVLPHRERIEEDEDQPKPFPYDTMELVVSLIRANHRAMFELLAATGVRRSELLALEARHLALDSDRPLVKIRQRVRRRKGQPRPKQLTLTREPSGALTLSVRTRVAVRPTVAII